MYSGEPKNFAERRAVMSEGALVTRDQESNEPIRGENKVMDMREAGCEIARIESALAEHTVDTRNIRVQPDCLLIGDRCLNLGDRGWAAFCPSVDAPLSYIERLDSDILAVVMQRHLQRGDLGSTVTAFEENGELVAFDRADLVRLKTTDVFQAVAESFGPDASDVEVSNVSLSAATAEFQFLSVNRLKNEVAPGDVVRAGLSVTHSPVGAHPTWVEAYLERLICRNGMLHRDHIGRQKPRTRRLPLDMPGAHDMQLLQVQRLATQEFATLDRKLNALNQLREERADVEPMLRRWLEMARLSVSALLPLLMEAWRVEGSEHTAYGVLNAITRLATHSNVLTVRQRRTIARLAGLLAFQNVHLCPRCFSVLRDAA
jgi:hypothetical protein